MRAIVHIGMHKTGTTSVKRYFKSNRAALLEQGILYPQSIGDLGMNAETKTGNPELLKKILAMELAQISDDGVVFISNENYFDMGAAHKEKMVRLLSSLNLEIEVLCYLRPQAIQAVSYYQQHTKQCFVRNISFNHASVLEYFDDKSHRGYYQYSRVLDKWAEYVPKQSIHVRAYDRYSLIGGSTIKDVASMVGFEVLDSEIVDARVSWSAESLCVLNGILMSAEGTGFELSKSDRQRVRQVLDSEIPGLPMDIPYKDKKTIAESCQPDNERLIRRYPGIFNPDLLLEQDINSVNGKLLQSVDRNKVHSIFRRLIVEVSALTHIETAFDDCLDSLLK